MTDYREFPSKHPHKNSFGNNTPKEASSPKKKTSTHKESLRVASAPFGKKPPTPCKSDTAQTLVITSLFLLRTQLKNLPLMALSPLGEYFSSIYIWVLTLFIFTDFIIKPGPADMVLIAIE